MTSSKRVIFAGTPDFAAKHLQALLDSDHEVVAVYTQPDRPAGRGKKLTPSAVKNVALAHSIPVYQPSSLKSDAAQQELASIDADVMAVVAYGLLLPKTVLDIPAMGCINVHGSLLPKWRGAAPIQRAVWAGDEETGITIMQMDEGLDTGDMLYTVRTAIDAVDTSASLYEKLAELGPGALISVLNDLESYANNAVSQNNNEATYAKKLSKEEALIDWSQSAAQIERNIRAFNPWPVAWCKIHGENVKIWAAQVLPSSSSQLPGTIVRTDKNGLVIATATEDIRLLSLQIPGKKPLAAADVLNARQSWFKVGTLLDAQQ